MHLSQRATDSSVALPQAYTFSPFLNSCTGRPANSIPGVLVLCPAAEVQSAWSAQPPAGNIEEDSGPLAVLTILVPRIPHDNCMRHTGGRSMEPRQQSQPSLNASMVYG